MTQTPQQPRDWQKDMDRIEWMKHARTLCNQPAWQESNPSLPEPLDIALEYWLQEAKKWREEALRKYPTPDAYEAACKALEKHRARADAAEEREQKLREVLETIGYAPIVDNYEIECNRHKRAANRLLSTLYTDTPVPKEGAENKCPGCGSYMVPQWGGDEPPDSFWEECMNPNCDFEEGDNQ